MHRRGSDRSGPRGLVASELSRRWLQIAITSQKHHDPKTLETTLSAHTNHIHITQGIYTYAAPGRPFAFNSRRTLIIAYDIFGSIQNWLKHFKARLRVHERTCKMTMLIVSSNFTINRNSDAIRRYSPRMQLGKRKERKAEKIMAYKKSVDYSTNVKKKIPYIENI